MKYGNTHFQMLLWLISWFAKFIYCTNFCHVQYQYLLYYLDQVNLLSLRFVYKMIYPCAVLDVWHLHGPGPVYTLLLRLRWYRAGVMVTVWWQILRHVQPIHWCLHTTDNTSSTYIRIVTQLLCRMSSVWYKIQK